MTPFEKSMDAFAASLEAHGVDQEFSYAIAMGYHNTLQRMCWRNVTDVVGDEQAIDKAIDWSGESGVVARAMQSAGLATKVSGLYILLTALVDCPQRIRKAWGQRDQAYSLAKKRGLLLGEVPVEVYKPSLVVEAEEEPSDTGFEQLWYEPPKNKRRHKRNRKLTNEPGTLGHKELREYWCQRWEEVHRVAPVFRGFEGKLIKELLKLTTDIGHAKAVVDRYLQDDYWGGHPLHSLVKHISRYLVPQQDHKQAASDRITAGVARQQEERRKRIEEENKNAIDVGAAIRKQKNERPGKEDQQRL